MGRTVEITLLGVDLLSRAMRDSDKATKKLKSGLEGLSKAGKVAGLASAAGGAVALTNALLPATAVT
jgi:hypothetical protein